MARGGAVTYYQRDSQKIGGDRARALAHPSPEKNSDIHPHIRRALKVQSPCLSLIARSTTASQANDRDPSHTTHGLA